MFDALGCECPTAAKLLENGRIQFLIASPGSPRFEDDPAPYSLACEGDPGPYFPPESYRDPEIFSKLATRAFFVGNYHIVAATAAEEIVRQIVVQKRKQAHGPLDDLLDDGKGLPSFSQHIEEAWRELEGQLAESNTDASGPVACTASASTLTARSAPGAFSDDEGPGLLT